MRNYILTAIFVGAIIAGSMFYLNQTDTNQALEEDVVKRFSSESEFREFISSDTEQYQGSIQPQVREFSTANRVTSGGAGAIEKDASVQRSSETNIQVKNVGEPDILKNDGKRLFYSPESRGYYREPKANTSVFDSLPAENFSEIDEIPENGEMFLNEENLIFLGQNISAYSKNGYDLEWSVELNSSVEAARKIDGKIYLVLKKRPDINHPCPVRPLESTVMKCTDFYRPRLAEGGDTTYTLVKMDIESGDIEKTEGFVASDSNSIVYVSKDSIYLTYSRQKSKSELMIDFLEEEGSKYFDSATMQRFEELKSYNISDESLMREIERASNNYIKSLDKKERKEFRESLEQGFKNYTAERKQKLSSTSIARFNLDLELKSEGKVPGTVDDRFSLDQSGENLRIATTVGGSWEFDTKSENDLYILDKELEKIGSIKGMGLNERIYSARYIDDKAYIVTFRRVDPFHVIDLSNPENPEMKGKLKLPGFSSYLHPLQEDRILGIGEENGVVKAVIFNVSNDNPSIVDSQVLSEWYTEVSDNHHAFKIDRENKVFFLPGSSKGHIFSYEDELEEVKTVNVSDPKRAAFVNQNFYVFGSHEAAVIDEETWETVKKIQFREEKDSKPIPLPDPIPPIR